jgi:hypothetical protein
MSRQQSLRLLLGKAGLHEMLAEPRNALATS